MTDVQKRAAATKFAEQWKGRGYEKGESQIFWTTLLTDVLGVEDVDSFITFEEQVKLDHTSFIDGHIRSTHVLIEQKSIDKDLRKPIRQSDGTLLTPLEQAQRYSFSLPYSLRPRWIVTCNFKEFLIYDQEHPGYEASSVHFSNAFCLFLVVFIPEKFPFSTLVHAVSVCSKSVCGVYVVKTKKHRSDVFVPLLKNCAA